jgi:hypothetical protein
MAARGGVPSLAEAIAGGPIRGSWWAHPRARYLYRVFESVRGSRQVLVCRLVGGKVTFVHRRLWPALVRLASRLPRRGLAAIREEHTARGHHRVLLTPFPRWVPAATLARARRLSEAEAIAAVGAGVLGEPANRKAAAPRGHRVARPPRRAGIARGRPSRAGGGRGEGS